MIVLKKDDKKNRDKKKKNRDNDKPKENSFRSFLKKRAPLYLAVVAIVVVFVIPELTKGTLESSLPELPVAEQEIVDILMEYDGPNEVGLTVMDAISIKVDEEYPNEKIYDDERTQIELVVTDVSTEEYQIVLNFKSYRGEMNYDWNVNINSEEIISNNQESKHIINLVDFYD